MRKGRSAELIVRRNNALFGNVGFIGQKINDYVLMMLSGNLLMMSSFYLKNELLACCVK